METDNTPPRANRQIARAAGSIMAAIIFSSLVGLVRQILVASVFGIGVELDAFNSSAQSDSYKTLWIYCAIY